MTTRRPSASLVRPLATAGVLGALLACGEAGAAGRRAAPVVRPDDATLARLMQKLDALAAQNQALAAKVERLEAEQARQAATTTPAPAAVATLPPGSTQPAVPGLPPATPAPSASVLAQQYDPTAPAAPAAAPTAIPATAPTAPTQVAIETPAVEEPTTVISSYGEINYTRPSKAPEQANVDIARAVIGLQHNFDDKTKVVAEYEWEHAITSSSDQGESEVEQLWVQRAFRPDLRGRAGLFLMPVGLINQNHEPTAYYGVYRPDVDTKIVPSTWREVGLGLSGDVAQVPGLNLDVALTSAPDLAKWDPASTEGRDRGPLQAIHGEGQFARARTLGSVAAVNYRGIPGLLLGGSVVYDNIGQGQPDFPGRGAKLFMFDVHGRYRVGRLDLAGEYIRATISHTEDLNQSFALSSVANPTLVPHLFYGGYVQAAYTVFRQGPYALSPFVRYEILNTAAGYGDLSVAAGGIRQPDEHILTVGGSLYITEGVVLKADYRDYRRNKYPDADHFNLGNSFNLGAGFAF